MRTKLAMLLLAGTSATAAAGPRQTREPADPGKVVLHEQTKARKPADAEPAGPAISGDKLIEIEKETLPVLEAIAQEYEALAKDTPDDDADEKADVLFRLAETYGRIARYHRLHVQELSIAGKDKDAEAAAAAFKKSAKSATRTFDKLMSNDDFKSYALMDRALFLYGYTLQQLGKGDAARKQYERLIKDHPTSPFIPDAQIVFGDYYFEQAAEDPDNREAHLRNALTEYEAVASMSKATLSTYAQYRIGWVHVNLGEYQDALAAFYQVTVDTKGDDKRKTLRRAAEKDLVRAYAEIGKADKAHAYFKKVDKDYAFQMLQILAETYATAGKDAKTIYTYRELMTIDPKHRDVCRWQYEVAHAMLTFGGNDDKVTEIGNLVALYESLGKRKGVNKDDLGECRESAAALSGDMARAYHAEWAKTLDPATLTRSIALYDVYLGAFTDDDTDGMTEYYRADLLWARAEGEPKSKQWDDVAVAFGDVVRHARVDAAHLEESAYAAVLALDNAQSADPRIATLPQKDDAADQPVTPVAIPEREQKLIEAIDTYFTKVKKPKAEIAVDLAFVEANTYRRYDHLEEALPLLIDLVEHHRDTEKGAIAVDLLLHTLNRLGRHDEMIAWVEKLLADDKFLAGKDELTDRLRGLRQTARRKQAEQCEKDAAASKDEASYLPCGELYFTIFNDDPDAPDADVVLYNAAVDFEHAKSIGTAIDLYENLARMFPKSKVTARAIVRTGEAYGRIAWYDQAAERFETYAKKYAGEDDAHVAMNNAVLYRKGIGDDAKAIADTKFYVDTFEKQDPTSAAEAYYSMASIYDKQGDDDAVVAHLRKYLTRFGKVATTERVVSAYMRIGKILWTQACEVKSIDGSCVKVKRERVVRGKRGRANSTPTRCGSDDKISLKVVARDESKVKQAMKAFAAAISAYEKAGSKLTGDARAAKAAYAQALFLKTEVAYEGFLAKAFPGDLDFSSETKTAKSLARFDQWMADKLALGEKARKGFDAVLATKDPAAAVAAAARLGQLQQNFSDALFSAPIPEAVAKYEDSTELYCDTLMDKAEPLELASIDAFGFCLETSTKMGWYSEWSRLCERELGQIKPEEYPTASELRATPDRFALVTTLEAPVIRLP